MVVTERPWLKLILVDWKKCFIFREISFCADKKSRRKPDSSLVRPVLRKRNTKIVSGNLMVRNEMYRPPCTVKIVQHVPAEELATDKIIKILDC